MPVKKNLSGGGVVAWWRGVVVASRKTTVK